MPITITQALDLPVAVVLLMFIPIGFWRGALREWVACAGIALGILLADAAGTRWGDGFAQLANMDPKLGGFTIGAGFLLASVLLVGYGGGLALPYRPDLSWSNRGLGALLGLGNGFLIIGGLLRLMQGHLFDGRSNSPLHTAALAAFLIDASIAWVYLGLFLSLLLCVILGLIRRVNDGTPFLEEYGPTYHIAPQRDRAGVAQREPQPLPAETWSTEPAASAPPTPIQETQPLRLVTVPGAVATQTPGNGAAPAPTSARPVAPAVARLDRPASRPETPAAAVSIERRRSPEPVPPTGDQAGARDVPTLIPRPIADHVPPSSTRQMRELGPQAATPGGSCPICSAPLPGSARFCGNCGHITGAAERRQIARLR